MIVTKTIQAGIVNLTNVKRELIKEEYYELNRLVQWIRECNKWGVDEFMNYGFVKDKFDLYSANIQQALRYYKKIKKDKEYPLSIRKDTISIKKCESSVADYFVKIPVAGRRGGIHAPINTHMKIPDEFTFCESKLYKKNDRFFINITIKYEVKKASNYNGVLGVDLGLRNPVVSVALPDFTVQFQGDEIKKIQMKYFYLRKHSTNKKSWRKREYNKVRNELHQLTTRIANYCKEHKLIFVVGDLKGIQNQNKSRRMNRELHNFPHHTFRKMMEYKLKDRGLTYVEVSEAYTSQTCYKCGEKGLRKRGIFKCGGSELNSDVNGAVNIGKRALGKPEIRSMLGAGASVTTPRTAVNDATNAKVSCGGERNHISFSRKHLPSRR